MAVYRIPGDELRATAVEAKPAFAERRFELDRLPEDAELLNDSPPNQPAPRPRR